MLNRSLLKTSLLIAGLATLGACSSDSSDDEMINPPNTTGDTPTTTGDNPTTMGDTGSGTDPNPEVEMVVGANPDLASPIPKIVTMACGDVSISETRFSSTQDAPAMITADEVVRGPGRSRLSHQHYALLGCRSATRLLSSGTRYPAC